MVKDLAKAYEPSLYEDGIYKKWEESGKFNPDNLDLPETATGYAIIMPPPNVTGTLHMGHAVMLALEDILTRYHRMNGERALWLPGTDHAAIATQTRVEKDLKNEGLDRHQLGREEFLKRVRQFAQESHDTIINQVKKMGSSCDWSREAYTLDEVRTRAVRSVFKLMYDDGLIYRGDRVVNWCPRCQSTLADDEVEYEEQKGKLYTFRYGQDFPFAIATTRPETKLGDTAVAVNPGDARYKKYIGKTFAVDFVGAKLSLKVIADHNVDAEFGTGALGVTPAHSMIDWQIAQENDLPVVKVIDEQGRIREGFGDYSGKSVLEARQLIVERLKSSGLFERPEEEVVNNLSVCYRCGTPIEPLPSRQWFIDVNKKVPQYGKSLKELSIEAVEKGVFGQKKIRVVPERFEKNYFHWMRGLHDWCISRQIWFGHQVPVWYCRGEDKDRCLPECSKPIVAIDQPSECPACGSHDLIQDEDTLDTWFSSGLWTFSTLASKPEEIKIENGKLVIDSDDFKKFHPTAVLETGYDILFFWVARMIIMTTYAIGDIPFQDVYLHGLVRDENGKKMSKSLGNVIDPLEMIKKYGADATRLSLIAGTTPGNDMNLSEEKVAGFRNFTNKLWNIVRYASANYELKIRDYELSARQLTSADSWTLSEMQKLIKETADSLDNYQFSQTAESLREFTWDILADWYLEASKFEKSDEKGNILSIIINDLLKLWHPFIPFVTEAIWKNLEYPGLLMTTANWPNVGYYKNRKYLKDSEEVMPDPKNFELAKNIIIAVRNARAEYKIEPVKKIKAVICAGDKKELVESQAHLIKGLRTGIEELEIKAGGEKIDKAIYLTVNGVEIYLLGAVDGERERERLEKEIARLEKLIAANEERLTNQEFITKAPASVVAKEKTKLDGLNQDLAKLKQQLKP